MHRLQKRSFGALSTILATLVMAFALAGMVPGSAVAQQGPDIIGNWSLSWQGARDTYAGRLDVLRRIGPNRYYGKVTLLPSRGQMVTQEVRIVVDGSQVDIECYNPSRRSYNPTASLLRGAAT